MGLKEEALSTAAEAMASGGVDAQEQADSLIDAFEKWDTTREYAKKERKRCDDLVDMRLASLKEAMEVGHSTPSAQLIKLTEVEARWQELEESRTERKEVKAAMRDSMKLAENKIRELIESMKSPQLGLFSTSKSTIDNPPQPEEEDDDEQDELP